MRTQATNPGALVAAHLRHAVEADRAGACASSCRVGRRAYASRSSGSCQRWRPDPSIPACRDLRRVEGLIECHPDIAITGSWHGMSAPSPRALAASILRQYPFAHTAFAVVVASATFRNVARPFEGVVKIPVDEEFDPLLYRDFVAADRPASPGFFTGIKPIDVDERAFTPSKSIAQSCLVGKRTFKKRNVPNRQERSRPPRYGASRATPNSILPDGVFLVRG